MVIFPYSQNSVISILIALLKKEYYKAEYFSTRQKIAEICALKENLVSFNAFVGSMNY